MCRWLAYSGSSVCLEDLLFKPKNSLVVQSKHSKLGADHHQRRRVRCRLVRRRGTTPGVFRSTEPAWNDRNLRELSAHAQSERVFAHIRASTGSAVQQTNCHPFRHGAGCGCTTDCSRASRPIKRDLAIAVDPALFPEIEGSTDSEMLFFLALTFGLEDDPPTAVARAVGLVEETGAPTRDRGAGPDDRRHHRRRDHLGVPLLQRGRVAVACSTAPTCRRCATSTPTTPRCTTCPTTLGSWSPNRSATCRVHGARSPSRPASSYTARTRRCTPSRRWRPDVCGSREDCRSSPSVARGDRFQGSLQVGRDRAQPAGDGRLCSGVDQVLHAATRDSDGVPQLATPGAPGLVTCG